MSNTFKVVVGIILLAGVVPAVGLSFESGAAATTFSEATSVDYSDPYEVGVDPARATIYDNETVTANGTTLVEGTDYEFDAEAGELAFASSGSTSAGEDATINYTAAAPGEGGDAALGLIYPVGVALVLGFLVVAGKSVLEGP